LPLAVPQNRSPLHCDSRRSILKALSILRSLRPREWLKNGFVLAPLFFSGNLYARAKYPAVLLTVAAFCLAASAIYLVNDVMDREADRQHPLKCRRPIAAGRLGVQTALLAAALLTAGGWMLAWQVNRATAACVAAYSVLTLAYCLALKRVLLLDAITIAAGFVLRAVAGAVAIQVYISHWLVVCTFSLAMFLALGKRLYELHLLGDNAELHRKVLFDYSEGLLKSAILATGLITLATYALYTVYPLMGTPARHAGLILTLPLVALGLGRYTHLVFRRRSGGCPSETLLSDRLLLLIIAVWAVTVYLLFELAKR